MREGFKAYRRRKGDSFWDEVFVGDGLDVGVEDNVIQKDWYPKIKSLVRGVGQYGDDLRKYSGGSFDFISVGECLEHEKSVFTAVLAWFYLLKPGGHIALSVPDFKLYESERWPSPFNSDHKWSFSLLPTGKSHSRHINLIDFISQIPGVQIRRIHLADSHYNYEMPGVDQTLGEAEGAIEVVLRKFPVADGRKRTFKHSGARGDLIYALPAIKMLGGGKLYLSRKKDHFFGFPVDDEEMKGVSEFLKTQPYIDSVQDWDGQTVDFDLDTFRNLDPAFILLPVAYLMRFGVLYDLTMPWIDKVVEIPKAEIVVSRTDRYHSPFDWGELAPWIDKAAFVGSKSEHEEFVRQTGLQIRYEETKTWMELAGVIRGSKLFVGNQSFAYSLAEAMKHPRVLEVCSLCPNCDPQGKNGHVCLSEGVIRKYLMGEEYDDVIRASRQSTLQVPFEQKKVQKIDYRNVSCVLVGNTKVGDYEAVLKGYGLEVVRAGGETFEKAANFGVGLTSRRIICVVDVDLCPDVASIAAVIDGMIQIKAGMVATSTSTVGMPHVSGPCFAITRETYEKAGLFNSAMRPGEAAMLEMVLRYNQVGIVCRSVGVPGWKGRPSNPDDEARNLAYLERNYGVKA